jgi:hypothetical protein
MAAEGIGYTPIDKELSGDRWKAVTLQGTRTLLGPVSLVKGIGPKMMSQIVSARTRGEPLPSRAAKLLENAKTDIDSLWPIRDAFARLLPDPQAKNIITLPTAVKDIVVKGYEYSVVAFVTTNEISPRDENDAAKVAKRGYKLNGPTQALNLRLMDDTDIIFAKIGRRDYERIGRDVVARGRAGKALYVVKGNVPKDFRMISVKAIRYIGDLEE